MTIGPCRGIHTQMDGVLCPVALISTGDRFRRMSAFGLLLFFI